MDKTLPANPDGPIEPEFANQNVELLYLLGQISRAEADVFDVIANCNDEQGGITCQAS